MKKTFKSSCFLVVIAILFIFVFTSCTDYVSSTGSSGPAAQQGTSYVNPTVTVDRISAKAGAKSVKVKVSLHNNPGILGMDFSVSYDESALTLVGASSKVSAQGVNYQAPSYFRNPTSFLWDFQDGNWNSDGVILELLFDVAESANGTYNIGLNYQSGDIFDNYMSPVNMEIIEGAITVN